MKARGGSLRWVAHALTSQQAGDGHLGGGVGDRFWNQSNTVHVSKDAPD